MKKIFITAMLFVSVSSFSQIELIETVKTEILGKVSLAYIEKAGNSFNFYYNNMNSPVNDYKFFSFKNENNDIDKLYNILMNGFKEKPRDPYKVKANGEVVWFKYVNDNGGIYLQIQQYVSRDPDVMTTSKLISKEEVQQLFNKQ